jgi:hypothetical protein
MVMEQKAYVHGWSGTRGMSDGVPSDNEGASKKAGPLDWLKAKLGLGRMPSSTDSQQKTSMSGELPSATDNQDQRGA